MRRESRRKTVCVVWGFVLLLTCAPASADDAQESCVQAHALGGDLRGEGRFSSAREQLLRCTDPSCPAQVRSECSRRLDELEKAQPTVVFDVKDKAGHDLSEVKATIDGKPVVDALTGAALPVDPGLHTYRLEAAGRVPYGGQFVLREGQRQWTEQVVMEFVPSGSPRTVPVAGAAQRTEGFVVGGIGAASLIAGAVFGGLSIAAHDSYVNECGSNIGVTPGACNQAGIDGERDAAMKGTFSTVFFIGGGALTVAGVVLFFTAPAPRGGVRIGIAPGGAVVGGQF